MEISSITSIWFLVFVGACLIVYYLAGKQTRPYLLLAFSLIFFVASCGYRMIIYLFFGIAIAYIASTKIYTAKNEKTKKIILAVAVILLIGELATLKWYPIVITTSNVLANLFSINIGMENINIIAPLGLSYYTLSIIGYVTDIYREEYQPQKNVVKLGAFVCYFPHMISGPIVRYNELSETLYNQEKFNYNNVKTSFFRILYGLFQKLIIADRLGIAVTSIYSNTDQFQGFYIIMATIAFAFQIYMDFAGCMNIMLGTSQAFGIRLPENFNQPFFSQSLSEFWRRWHITLGLWVKDYMLYPMLKSGVFQKLNKKLKKRFNKKMGNNLGVIIGTFLIWMFIGIWHGGTYQFIFASGFIQWFWISSGTLLDPVFKRIIKKLRINDSCDSYKVFRMVRTIGALCIGWIVMCSSGFMEGLENYSRLIVFNPSALLPSNIGNYGIDMYDLVIIVVALLFVLFMDIAREKGINIYLWLNKQNIIFQWTIIYIFVFGIIIFGVYGVGYDSSSFIYGGF